MIAGARSILRTAMALAMVFGFGAVALAQASGAPSAAPVMTEELMARLIKYTRGTKGGGTLSATSCKALDLCDGTQHMPFQHCESDVDGHYFGFHPEDRDAKNIVIVVKRGRDLEAYLTDKAGKLRAAAVEENGVARLITNEKAAAQFQAELALFAKEAAEQLPPTR